MESGSVPKNYEHLDREESSTRRVVPTYCAVDWTVQNRAIMERGRNPNNRQLRLGNSPHIQMN